MANINERTTIANGFLKKCWQKGQTATLALRYFKNNRHLSFNKHGFNIDEYEETEEKKRADCLKRNLVCCFLAAIGLNYL